MLKYCERDNDLKNIFVDNDYLVIQIDTDQSQTKPFAVSHTKPDSTLKTVEELYYDVIEKLRSLIDPGILQLHADKIFFAISIHTIECWLLPIYYSNKHKSDTNTCILTLNVELKRHNILNIPTVSKNKNIPSAIRTYDTILKNWKRQQNIMDAAQHNPAFQKFLESMAVVRTP